MPGKTKEQRLQDHVQALLEGMGLDPEESGLVNTPERVIRFLAEYSQPVDLDEVLTLFDAEDNPNVIDGPKPMVIQSNIPFAALCEHHLLPFFGKAAIGYVPRKTVVGLSKLTRFVKAAGRIRPTIQERITELLADTIHRSLECQGVIVVVQAEHTCMSIRGVSAPGVITSTSAVRGIFRDVPAARSEFFDVIKRNGHV